ncbi:MAG: D-aminoacyl-tRNA deacylase [Egibacteraceae bacterium]
MRVVLQRVASAVVEVDGEEVGRIDRGLVALVGVGRASTEEDARWLAGKTVGLRLFPGGQERMAASVSEVGGAVLAVSQFPLHANARKGRRPSFAEPAEPARGAWLYERYCEALTVPVARGVFGADMRLDLRADGPVTIILRSDGGVRDVG